MTDTKQSWSERKAREEGALVREYFPKHHAEYHEAKLGRARVERLVWRNPESSINRIDYLCDGPRLFVAGDLGEGVYLAGANDLAWWAACDLSYFASKCMASEYGRGYESWNAEVATARVREEVRRRCEEENETVAAELVDDCLTAIANGRGEWDGWMRNSASELFGDEWWDYVPNFGVVVDQRCRLHLLGLKTAIAQVDAERAA
jgi:hypothetical protein